MKTVTTAEFIHDRLYAKSEGYFSKQDNQLGLLKEPIPFAELFGYEDYVKLLYERYPKGAWLTPSEIFKPYYGMTIANYIDLTFSQLQATDPSTRGVPIHIIEAGAGNGSAASSILNYFKIYKPKSYRSLKYTIVEISDVMIERCRKTLEIDHGQLLRSGQIEFKHCSIVDYPDYHANPVFLILLEVLDNMPHDRVYFKGDKLEQAFVEMDGEKLKEIRKPLVDPQIESLYKLWKGVEEKRELIEENDKNETLVAHSNRRSRDSTRPSHGFTSKTMCSCRRAPSECSKISIKLCLKQFIS